MKKITLLILTAVLILCMLSTSFSVSAEDVLLNSAGKGWKAYRANNRFVTEYKDGYEFHYMTDGDMKTWTWPICRVDGFDEGTIKATVSPNANIGVLFGGTGIKEYVGESYENITGSTTEKRGSLGRTDKDVRFYWAAVVYENGAPVFKLFVDDGVSTGFSERYSAVLDDNAYKIDGVSDIDITVRFNRQGECFVYVNDCEVYSSTELTLFGDQYGMIVYNATYSEAHARVGYVRSFAISAFEIYPEIPEDSEDSDISEDHGITDPSEEPDASDDPDDADLDYSAALIIVSVIVLSELVICIALIAALVNIRKKADK